MGWEATREVKWRASLPHGHWPSSWQGGAMNSIAVRHPVRKSNSTSGKTSWSRDFAARMRRSLGIEGGDAPDTLRVPVRPGDVFLICSDGVYDSLPLEEIRCTLQRGDPRQAC